MNRRARRFLRDWSFEVPIILLGLLASVIELFVVTDKNLGTLILVVSILLTASTAALRKALVD